MSTVSTINLCDIAGSTWLQGSAVSPWNLHILTSLDIKRFSCPCTVILWCLCSLQVTPTFCSSIDFFMLHSELNFTLNACCEMFETSAFGFRNKYERTMVSSAVSGNRGRSESGDYEVVNGDDSREGSSLPKKRPLLTLVPGSGKIVIQHNLIKWAAERLNKKIIDTNVCYIEVPFLFNRLIASFSTFLNVFLSSQTNIRS